VKRPNIQFINDILNDPEKRKIFFVSIAAFVVIAYAFIASPQVLNIVTLSSANSALKNDLKNARKEIDRIPLSLKMLEEQKDRVFSGQVSRLLQEGEMPNLLEAISAMANSSGVKIIGITPVAASGGETKNAAYREAQIMIIAKSGYHELGLFINKIENAVKFMNISDISIISNNASPKKHDVKLLISAYVLVPEKGA